MTKINITFSSCWYHFKSKFDATLYYQWIDNMLSNVVQYYLVVYTDEEGFSFLQKYSENPRIKIVIKPYTKFFNYRYKDNWIKNHQKNWLLHDRIDWKVNMLWSEKIHFVKQTIEKKYFDTDFYGWCDIGYFRNRSNDMRTEELKNWPNQDKIEQLDRSKIYYAYINNDHLQTQYLMSIINQRDTRGLSEIEIPSHQISVAGGFFILFKENIDFWSKLYNERLVLYFETERLVKDDQIILIDCIFSNLSRFYLCRENTPHYDNWFLLQRFLL
jgi:hypothetical protein